MSKLAKKTPVDQSISGTFKPTLLMERFAETMVRLGSDNVAEIVRETPMSESQYYEWKKLEGFSDWLNQYAMALLRGDGWKLNAIGMKNAKRDHRYWADMQKIVGNIKEDKSTTINIANLIQSQKEEFNLDE